jgi:hypothetical protein
MRCKNCGWDNPNENSKCKKCNATLSVSIINTADTLSVNEPTSAFDPKKTATGCPECGYPIRPSDTSCPNCNHLIGGTKEANPPSGFPPNGGTVIYKGPESVEKPVEGKKLVGFLVTYTQTPLGEFFPLYEGRNNIGRDSSVPISLSGDTQISAKHFSILYRSVDRKFKFKDELSSNGTFINEVLMDDGELKNFDTIRVGSTKLLFIEIPVDKLEISS